MHYRIILLLVAMLFTPLAARAQDDLVIYDDARQNGWQDYGWATINYANTSPVHSGSNSIGVTDTTSSYKALFLHHAAFDTSLFQSLSFWIYPTTSGSNQLGVQAMLNGAPQTVVSLSFTAAQLNAWQHVTIPLASLGAANKPNFDGFWIQNITGAPLATFYVDDIALVAAPPPNPVQLNVNAQSAIRTIDGRIYGLNLAIWDPYLSVTTSASLLATMDTRVVRVPGGSASDDYDWQTDRGVSNGSFQWSNSAASFARVAEARGAQAYVTVNYGSGTPEQAAAWVAYYNGNPSGTASIGVDAKSRDWKTVGYWATMRASAPLASDDGYNFLRASHAAPYGFRYWEIGNECYGDWEYDQHGGALSGVAHDPFTYAQAFKNFYDKMLAADPTIRIGAVGVEGEDKYGNGTHAATNPNENNSQHSGWTPVVLATLKSLGVTPHFVIHHYYAQNPGNESDAVLLASGAGIESNAANIRKMIGDYMGASGMGIELALTELNSVSSNPGKQSASLVNGLFMADAIGHVARTEFNACTWWDFRNGATNYNNSPSLYGWRQYGDYGVVQNDNTRLPNFYAAKLLTHWGRGGDTVVSVSSNYPLLAVHAAKLANGNLALLVVNKSAANDLPAQIALNGFIPGSATADVFQYGKQNDAQNSANPDLTTGTFNNASATFNYTFPSYSMTVIVLQKPMTYDLWRALHFTPSEIADETKSGFTADYNFDGIANGMEYALGLDPKTFSAPGLPAPGKLLASGKHYMTLTFTKPRTVGDILYEVQSSANLTTWYSDAAHVVRVDDGSTNTAIYRSLTAIEDAPRIFMRLKATRQ